MQFAGATAGVVSQDAIPAARLSSPQIFADAPVEMLFGKGIMSGQPTERGLFATQDLPAGYVVFEEKPLVAVQLNKAECAACEHCSKFLGKLSNAKSLSVDVDRADLTEIVPCDGLCGELYCSETCREASMEAGHEPLCSGRCESMEEPLIHFKVHAMETLDAFLLAGKAFAQVLANAMVDFKKEGVPCSPVWYNIDQFAPTTGTLADTEENDDERAFLESLCETSYDFLIGAFKHYLFRQGMDAQEGENLLRSFTLYRYSNLMLKLRRNSFGISVPNPLVEHVSDSQKTLSEEDLETLLGSYVEELRQEELHNDCETCDSHEGHDDDEDKHKGCAHGDDEDCDSDYPEYEDELNYNAKDSSLAKSDAKDAPKNPGPKDSNSGASDDNDDDDDDDDDDDEELTVPFVVENIEDWFAPVDGEALFSGACVINHSAQPNIRIEYVDCNKCRAVTLREIPSGTELVHDYVRFLSASNSAAFNNDVSLEDAAEERKRVIAQYGIEESFE